MHPFLVFFCVLQTENFLYSTATQHTGGRVGGVTVWLLSAVKNSESAF